MQKNRMGWVDGMKFLAILWIFCGHFFQVFDATWFQALRSVGNGYVFYGVTGKMCVALFCVFLGYFCAGTGRDESRDCAGYILRRYVYFVLWMLAALGLISAVIHLDRYAHLTNYIYRPILYGPIAVLSDAVQLGTNISETYWCVRPFVIASVAVVVINRRGVGLLGQLLIAWLLYLGRAIWVMNCFLGSILFCLVRDPRTEKAAGRWYVRLAMAAAAFMLIKRDENFVTYALDGVAMTLLVLAVYYSVRARKVLGFRQMAVLGRCSMGVYMLHVPIFNSLGCILCRQLETVMAPAWASAATALVCFSLCFPLAWVLEKLIAWLADRLAELPGLLKDKTA